MSSFSISLSSCELLWKSERGGAAVFLSPVVPARFSLLEMSPKGTRRVVVIILKGLVVSEATEGAEVLLIAKLRRSSELLTTAAAFELRAARLAARG